MSLTQEQKKRIEEYIKNNSIQQTSQPTSQPTRPPTIQPTIQPTKQPTIQPHNNHNNSGDIQSLADLMLYSKDVTPLLKRMNNNLVAGTNIIFKNGRSIKYIDNSMTTGNNRIHRPSLNNQQGDLIGTNKCFFISLWHLNKDFFMQHGYYSPYSLYINSGYNMINKNPNNCAAIDMSVDEKNIDSIGPFLLYLEDRLNKPIFLHCLDIIKNDSSNMFYCYAFSDKKEQLNPTAALNHAAKINHQNNNFLDTANLVQNALGNGFVHLYLVRQGLHFPNAADDR